MMTWKDGGMRDGFSRRIVYEDGSAVCCVRTRRAKEAFCAPEPWPEGKANFDLILQAPRMLEALEAIVVLGNWMEEKEIVCNRMEEIARAAIAAVKGE